MYKLLFIFILFGAFSSCKPKILPTVTKVTPDEVIAKFSHMTTMGEIAHVAILCAQNDINFQYAGTEFFEDNRVKKLMIQVTLPNGQTGKMSADITNLQYKYYGFMYNSNGYFKVGQLE